MCINRSICCIEIWCLVCYQKGLLSLLLVLPRGTILRWKVRLEIEKFAALLIHTQSSLTFWSTNMNASYVYWSNGFWKIRSLPPNIVRFVVRQLFFIFTMGFVYLWHCKDTLKCNSKLYIIFDFWRFRRTMLF